MPATTPVDQFSALADPTRCRVIEMLHERPMPVHELTAAFDISRPAISRHLRVLKDARLVKEEKQGRENVYSLQRARLTPMATWLDRLGPKPAVQAEPIAIAPKAIATPKSKAKAEPKVKLVAARPLPMPKAPAPQMQLDLF
jgi:DNA-binding transcriptional ArsR family regulator